ncbi:uncharacterized protein BT62DRAFT_931838 [Guyanagaster necrorhizus]|uniref:J domain-containing protein n=1 Tax=Guyanagaster necrorhizus TaxID=856835 RepID=A0A9P7VTG9_9AGAR|nr:uncharacterized protein BT62DRAFT_931838 [Guyanagaster necrorhizus MCA 3950]KAG7446395.1 hypothetical protein BT62DRAFT_931838 [Guyanagaster necrorhizus MCA 3950]
MSMSMYSCFRATQLVLARRLLSFHETSRRSLATKPNSYPFPQNSNPTPHQIFHLPRSASPEDVKARYYELVRLYHPDTVDLSVSSELAHARFQSITDAYNVLRGKTTSRLDAVSGGQQATTAARRAMHVRRHSELYEGGAVDDRWKDRLIIVGLIATVIIIVAQAVLVRRTKLQEARTLYSRPSPPQEDSRLSSSVDPES